MVMVEAIRKYVDAVAVMKPEELGGAAFIHPESWIKVSQEIKKRLDEAYK
jgi:predicted transcriptional regulator